MDEKLPLGSIISLTSSSEMKIIIGYNFMKEQNGEIYDYAAFPYPIGYVGLETEMSLFNDQSIELLYHKGFECENLEQYFEIIDEQFKQDEIQKSEVEEDEFFEL